METAAARMILADTFSQPFDKDRFRKFTKELLKDFEEKTFVYSGMTIPDAYKDSISTLERVGKYIDRDGQKIDILIVRLCKETSLENARTRHAYSEESGHRILKSAASESEGGGHLIVGA